MRDAPVAQLDRAPPSEGGGHTFESCRVRHLSKESFAPWVAATGAAAPRPPLETPSPFWARCRLPRTSLWMNRLPAGEHFHKLRDPLGARFGPFGIVHPVDDRVA